MEGKDEVREDGLRCGGWGDGDGVSKQEGILLFLPNLAIFIGLCYVWTKGGLRAKIMLARIWRLSLLLL